MKTILCVLFLAAAVYGAEEKKTEKRGVLGLGYGVGAHAPLVGHGLYGGLGHGLYGGHGLGLYSHGVVASAPLVSHAAPIAYGSHLGYGGLGYGGLGYGGLGYGGLGHGGLGYGAPLLGLGHGYLH